MLRINIFSVRLSVSFWALLPVSFAVVSSVGGQQLVLICLLCTIVHEAGHLVMICRYRGRPDSISVYPFEIRINSDLTCVTAKEELFIVSFGIIFNLLLSAVAGLLYLAFPDYLLLEIAFSSLCIGLLNLIPAESFDGGQLFRMILLRFFSQKVSDLILNVISMIMILPLTVVGVAVMFLSQYNFSVLFIALFLISIYISKELR